MGSSPVTATISPPTPDAERVRAAIRRFFLDVHPLPAAATVLVAFSGGPDSLALLAGLAALGEALDLRVVAAHLDHGLDPDSARRAARAGELAAALGVPCAVARRPVGERRRPGESLETAARRVRYEFLEEQRQRAGAAVIATAHHRDDQAETVALRLLAGTGLAGLRAIQPCHGNVVRPLLELGRDELRAALATRRLRPTIDPTNADGSNRRSAIRGSGLLARLDADPDRLARRLAGLAAAAAAAHDAIERRLHGELRPRREGGSIRIDRARLERLPLSLREPALALLHRLAAIPYPARSRALAELSRQLANRRQVRCHCGGGWEWLAGPQHFELRSPPGRPRSFTYTVHVPGVVAIPELGLRLRLTPTPVADWMYAGDPRRAGLALPLAPDGVVMVRNRRAGDRLRPLGAPGERRLKDILIDRRVPAARRDAIPLLIVDGRIAWVPGVTIDERFRLPGAEPVWLAELEGG